MTSPTDILVKNKGKYIKIFPSTFEFEDLEKIWSSAIELNEQARKEELDYIERFSPSGFDRAATKIQLENTMFVVAELWTEDGSLTKTKNFQNPKNLSNSRITKLVIENMSQYRLAFNRNPQHLFQVEMDFSTPTVKSLLSNASQETSNQSRFTIIGMNETWVDGAYMKLKQHFQGKRNLVGALHGASAYDFVLWFFFVPVWFAYMFKFSDPLAKFVQDKSTGFSTLFYLWSFLFYLLFARTVFNYIRWLWPYLQIGSNVSSFRKIQRALLYFVFVTAGALPFVKETLFNFLHKLISSN